MDINYKLIVDTRERKIHDNDNFKNLLKTDFTDLDIEIVVKQLSVSDFAITYRDHLLMLIERKTWKDLSQTMRDNKRKYNYKKMLDEKKNSKSCLMVAYLIEGPFKTNRKSKVSRIPLSSLKTHLDHLSFEYGIHIFYSKNKLI